MVTCLRNVNYGCNVKMLFGPISMWLGRTHISITFFTVVCCVFLPLIGSSGAESNRTLFQTLQLKRKRKRKESCSLSNMFTFNNGSIASHCHICKHLGKTSKLNLFQLQSGHHSLFQRVLFMFSLVADLFSPHFIYFFLFYCETRIRPGSQINTCTAS